MLPTLRETVDFYGLMANRSLGQNFLLDSNITDKIIGRSLEHQGLRDFSAYNIVEIGPGPGGLTRSILKNNPQSLAVIEMDSRCIRIMEALDRPNELLDVSEIIENSKITKNCFRCGTRLMKSPVEGYTYYCHNCDEDFCSFEQ